MTHRRAVATMLLVTLLWSIAGVVTRHLQSAAAFEVTFWRSAANAGALGLLLGWQTGFGALWQAVRSGGPVLWWSGLCWAVMFTAFMVAMTLTTVANVLITMSLSPMFTALIARFAMGQRLPARTWVAIVLAGAGISWMYLSQLGGAQTTLLGTLVCLTVPMGGSAMWALAQHNARQHPDEKLDMTPAVLIGAVISSLATLPLSLPFVATGHDVALLMMLGVVQLAIPCVLAVSASRVLKAPEAALLSLLEILFGVAWAWLGTSEAPTPAVIGGGSLVLLALAGNELVALLGKRATA